MSRFARDRRVFFLEEPVFEAGPAELRVSVCRDSGVRVYTPVLPHQLGQREIVQQQRDLLDAVLLGKQVSEFVAWYYTPMAREFSNHLHPQLIVYDCMDELSAFDGAPAALKENETELFGVADLIFTGGASLYEAKKTQHDSIHLFPSSVDAAHFEKARSLQPEPDDQAVIPHPRIGYAGVIDERMDLDLLKCVSQARPAWHLVLLGPVVKIDFESLPVASNIHYLGMKSYSDLPEYLAGWDIAMLPFALNQSTRFISPTKTPEYLAAGRPIISTAIADVIAPYGDLDLVKIADTPDEFIALAETLLAHPPNETFLSHVDSFLSHSSWDKTWSGMSALMESALAANSSPNLKSPAVSSIAGMADSDAMHV